jgi:hypothetical protein
MVREYLFAPILAVLVAALAGCGRAPAPGLVPTAPSGVLASSNLVDASAIPPVYVALFTHIEDNTPTGTLGSAMARTSYMNMRARLLELSALVERYGVTWSLQPDWKILLAARQYEDAATMASTGGVNLFRHLRDRGVVIDPHSHEGGGYNYSDVAYLLETLDVGGSTVIGGHVWDPALPQFAEWDRFRVPVAGRQYPGALWRGDILMGSGTPNHVNDPIVSGVWRPRDRHAYWEDDPAGNIAAVGAFKSSVSGVNELTDAYRTGRVDPSCMLTASHPISPSVFLAPGGVAAIESNVIRPYVDLRSSGGVELTDFTTLVQVWRTRFGARACTQRE